MSSELPTDIEKIALAISRPSACHITRNQVFYNYSGTIISRNVRQDVTNFTNTIESQKKIFESILDNFVSSRNGEEIEFKRLSDMTKINPFIKRSDYINFLVLLQILQERNPHLKIQDNSLIER